MFGTGTHARRVAWPRTRTLGSEMPIDTIVVLMMENRSFDHLLQNLPGVRSARRRGRARRRHQPRQPTARRCRASTRPSYCFDDTTTVGPTSHTEWDNGKMDGFVIANNHNDSCARRRQARDGLLHRDRYAVRLQPGQHLRARRSQLLARCSARPSPTASTSTRRPRSATSATTSSPTRCRRSSRSWSTPRSTGASTTPTSPAPVIFLGTLSRVPRQHLQDRQLLRPTRRPACSAQVDFVDPKLGDGGASRDDFHPPGDVQLGEQVLEHVVSALMPVAAVAAHRRSSSPSTSTAASTITCRRRKACPPDDIAPILGHRRRARRLRPATASACRSSWSRRTPSRTSSRTRSTTTRRSRASSRPASCWPALTARDANADPLSDMFDFKKAALPRRRRCRRRPSISRSSTTASRSTPTTAASASIPTWARSRSSAHAITGRRRGVVTPLAARQSMTRGHSGSGASRRRSTCTVTTRQPPRQSARYSHERHGSARGLAPATEGAERVRAAPSSRRARRRAPRPAARSCTR